MVSLAKALIERPSLAKHEELTTAYQYLAQHADEIDDALDYVNRGRELSRSTGRSCAGFDLMELPLRLERGQGAEFRRLIEHLQAAHGQEPGVGETLVRLLSQWGLVRPDGTVAIPVPRPSESSIVVPGAESERGKIWTPGSPQEPGGGQKLWTPG